MVKTDIYGKSEPKYIGCTLDIYEVNGYQDSDFYAVCWDDEQQKVVHVEYDTTRCGGGGYAEIDATSKTLKKVYRHYKRACAENFDNVINPQQAKQPRKGDTVQVIKGRKVKRGTICTVSWFGKSYNSFSRCEEERVGVIVDGKKVFISASNIEVIGWQDKLLTGKYRKSEIINRTVGMMPRHYQRFFQEKHTTGRV